MTPERLAEILKLADDNKNEACGYSAGLSDWALAIYDLLAEYRKSEEAHGWALAVIANSEAERDLAYAKLAASHDQINLTADARVFAVYGNKISELFAERDHLKLHIDVLESKISAILSEPKRPWAAYKQIEDERDALRHDMDRLSAADTEHCTALVAAEARALALERERDQWERNHEALQDKFDCNKTCGCAYDFADALCGYHSPRVIAAEARALALEMAFLDYLRWENSCRNPGPICTDMQRCGCWLEMQAALAQPKVTP